jgi:hypothetical protein
MPFLLVALVLQVQDTVGSGTVRPALAHRNGRVPPSITAVRTPSAIALDGRLTEPAWDLAPPATDFRRDVPSDGLPAAEPTEVRVLYDREALYVGARLHHRSTPISRRLSRRDSFSVFNDVFFVMIDSYHDHRTAFTLGVTPAGERRDMASSSDGRNRDSSWDPVWEAKTTIDSLGWTAEIRIPFSQLRFPPGMDQVWGIQFRRDIRAAGEAVDWAWTPRTESGQASKFGHLLGLSGIPAPGRLEVLPYTSGQARFTEGVAAGNPFDDGSVASWSGGVDLKYGLTSDLTLDATINPDFGQVEADPAVVNLTAFETFFEERRPFFVEGAGILDFGVRDGGQNFYYSRRIGRSPSRSALADAPFVDQPAATSIHGAVKLTGRTRSGWSIGALGALTGREFASLADSAGTFPARSAVEPRAGYGIVRIRRDLGEGSSGFGVLATGTGRDLADPVFAFLPSTALTGGFDFFHRFHRNSFEIKGGIGGSLIRGDTAAINLVQRASTRYFQRPDQSTIRFDPLRHSLSGFAAELNVGKISGDWLYELTANVISPGLELNDVGFQTQGDRIRTGGFLTRRWVRPGRIFRTFETHASVAEDRNFEGTSLRREIEASFNGEFLSFWGMRANVERGFRAFDDRATRGGPTIVRPAGWELSIGGRSDGRKVVSANGFAEYQFDEEGAWSLQLGPELTVRSGGAMSLSLSPRYERSHHPAFYVGTFADPSATTTLGARYLFAGLDQHTLGITARLNLVLTPNLSVQWFAQPLIATGDYDGFGELRAPRTYAFRRFGSEGSTLGYQPATATYTADPDGAGPLAPFSFENPDFRIRSLRSNLVFRWEYRPGSTLFLVWNQSRAFAALDPRFRAWDDLGDIFGDDQRNVLLIKANYYLSL